MLHLPCLCHIFFFFQAEDGIRDHCVTGVQTCALPIWSKRESATIGPDRISGTAQWTRASFCSTARVEKRCGQVLGLLVPVSSMRCRTSTSGLSTQSSSWGPYPVNPVGDLILERASRLDAFSGYPFRT